MNWKELIERTDEMIQVNSEDIINNPAEVNALIDGWNSLMKNEPELKSKQKNVYYLLCAARKVALMDTSNQILEIKKYYIK
jgi:hypothetical protein